MQRSDMLVDREPVTAWLATRWKLRLPHLVALLAALTAVTALLSLAFVDRAGAWSNPNAGPRGLASIAYAILITPLLPALAATAYHAREGMMVLLGSSVAALGKSPWAPNHRALSALYLLAAVVAVIILGVNIFNAFKGNPVYIVGGLAEFSTTQLAITAVLINALTFVVSWYLVLATVADCLWTTVCAGTSLTKVDYYVPYHADGVAGYGVIRAYIKWFVSFAALCGLALALLRINALSSERMWRFAVAVYVLVTPALVGSVVLGAHASMGRGREQCVAPISNRLREILHSTAYQAGDGPPLRSKGSEWKTLAWMYEACRALPAWPFDSKQVGRLVAVYVAPCIVIIIERILK